MNDLFDDFKGEDSNKSKQNKEDDMFGFRPEQPNTGYNPPSSTRNDYAETVKKDPSKTIFKVVLSIVLAITFFVAGVLTMYFIVGRDVFVMKWAFDKIDQHYVGDGSEDYTIKDYLEKAGRGLVSSLDAYSDFYTPEDVNKIVSEMEGKSAGYGVRMLPITYKENDVVKQGVMVHSISWGSPLERNGVMKAYDIIATINGHEIKTTDDVSNAAGASANFVLKRPASFDIQDNIGIIIFEEDEYSTGVVAAENYNASFIKAYVNGSANAPANLPSNAMYINFKEFSYPADVEFVQAMQDFKRLNKKDLILDMRDNGGGYLDIVQSIGSYFVKGTKKTSLMYAVEKNKKKTDYISNDALYDNMGFGKIVVLLNGGSASATEVLTCAMKDLDSLTAVVGTQSYGKGVMQQTYVHSSGYALKLTMAHWYSPKGSDIHKVGITPDHKVEMTAKYNQVKSDLSNDDQYLKALEILK